MAVYRRDRDEITKLKRAVTKKVSRIKRVGGVYVSGTPVDPRKSKPLDSMTRKELNAIGGSLPPWPSSGVARQQYDQP